MQAPTIRPRRPSFLRAQEGLAFIEFAFLLPILVLLFYGIIEVTRFIQMHQKLDNAGHQLVDLLNQNLNLSISSINDLISTVPSMVAPFDSEGVGVIISSIEVPESQTEPVTLWQVISGPIRGGSKVSAGKCEETTLPQIHLVERDQVLVVEMYLNYKPLVDNALVRGVLGLKEEGVYKINIARPRYGAFRFDPYEPGRAATCF